MLDFERTFRGNGIVAAVLFVVAYAVSGSPPHVGASADELVSFYDGDSTRILVATVVFGFAVLTLLWFDAALASVLREAGRGGWGTALTAASTTVGVILLTTVTLRAGLAYSIAGSSNEEITSALNDLIWVLPVIGFFPIAMMIMAGTFGLRRAGLISAAAFAAGVTAMVLVLLGTTAWAGDGFWAPDGAYAYFVPSAVMLTWVAVVSAFLTRMPSSVSTPKRAAVPAA